MNIVRIQTLACKECMRFLRVYNQTILSPVVNAVIFFIIFTVAFGANSHGFSGISYSVIDATGLISMYTLQASYYNTQSTISIAKMLGFIKDYTITPLQSNEIMIAMVIAGIVRAFFVGIITFVVLVFFVQIPIHNIYIAIYYILVGTILFAMIGIMVGFSSSDFDKAHAYTSYIITPLTMLSGTFYSAESLPQPWHNIVLFNPVFYIIDGFRFGMTGIGNHSVVTFTIPLILLVVCTYLANVLLKKGLNHG